MSEEQLIMHCSPTLAGLKTGNLFTAEYHSGMEIFDEIRRLNRILVPKGLRILPMGKAGKRVLIYVYRPEKLKNDFNNECVCGLLEEFGYPYQRPEECVVRLAEKLREGEDFPHEIGLFLGYPPEDVQGFIRNGAKNCKCVGCWKVYGNVEQAKKKFRQFQTCTDIYCAQWKKGFSIEQLIVAV